MDNSNNSDSWRSYSEVLLEEIALEGLDGITLELLWNRLKVNPEWKIPVDEFTEEFIWKTLISLDHVDWYALKEPRVSPPVFASTEELLEAVESTNFDVVNFNVNYYPHHLISDGNIIGSCSTYSEREKVTDEVRTLTLENVISRFGNRLVLVASQSVRNFVLISSNTNPTFEVPELSYCILERVGRGRRCGEFSVSLNFLRNGANPTFYYWNKLRKINVIKTQSITFPRQVRGTLIHLTKFHKSLPSAVENLVLQLIEKIKSSPVKMLVFSEAKDLFASSKVKKFTKTDVFRRYLKLCFVPYDEYYPEDRDSGYKSMTKNGTPRLIRVLKLITENYDELLQGASDENVNEITNEVDFIGKRLLHSRTIISQSYNLVQSLGDKGVTQVDVQNELGVHKLMARLILRVLQRSNLIVSVSSDNARKRFYRYYSKDYYDIVKSRIEEQVKVSEVMDTSVVDETDSTGWSTATEINKEVSLDRDQVYNECSEANEITESSYSNENSRYSEISEIANCSEIAEATKRQSSTDINKLDETSVKRPKLEDALSQDFLQNQIMSVMSESIKCSIPAGESVFVIRRINIVLNQVYKSEVLNRVLLPKIIVDEETKRGIYQGIPARKSLVKVVDILSKSGKVKIIKKTVNNTALNKSRELEFLCIPTASENHPVIQAALEETNNDLSVVYVKCGPKNCPEPDYQPREKSNKYGYGAKFNRMKVLHELLTYLVYHYDGKENLDPEESRNFVRPLLRDSESVDELPTIYKKEISWKMFIPPLMPSEEYGDGWISQNDLAERIPLKLFLNLIRIPYDHADIHEYLKHPIKRYYLLRHLPEHLKGMLSVDRKYLYSICLNLRLLCHIGLCQFGPKNKTRGFQNLVYVNKRTQLLDTRLSAPGYAYVSTDIEYPVIRYNLTDPESVEVYWNDALRFAVGTKLGRVKYPAQPGERDRCRRTPDRLLVTIEARTAEEVLRNDNGELPGNKLGAAGYDSWMFAYKHNQWFLNKYDSKRTGAPALPPKIPAPPPTKPPKYVPPKVPVKPVSKLKRFRHQVIRNREYNRAKITYDKVDIDALSKMQTLRAKWNKTEDEILLLCHIASKYYPNPPMLAKYRPYILIRKILHTLSERSRDKTVHACKRRIVSQIKNPLKQHVINLCLKEMAVDVQMKDKFRALCEDIDRASAARDTPKVKASVDKLTEEVFYYLYESKKITMSSKGTAETLPDSLDTFRENFTYEYATPKGNEKYLELTSKKEISTLLIVNLIFSALFSQVDKTKTLNTGFLYGVFKQFEDIHLKSALHFVRANRLISNNKSINRNRGLLLPIGSGVFHLSLTYHFLLKQIYRSELFTRIYSRVLESCSHEDNEYISIDNFDAGLSTLLISHSIQNNVHFQIEAPDSLLMFSDAPIVIDESVFAKAVVQAQKFSESTLSLVDERFSKRNDVDGPDNITNECSKSMMVEYNLGDDGDDEDEDDRLIDFSVSKISIYVTRNQFKHSDIRFSNAYDHFMVNPYLISYRIDDKSLQNFNCVNRTLFISRLQENVSFTKIRYSTNELQQKIRKCFHEPRKRDFAISVLEFLLIKGVCGVTTTELSTEFPDVQLLKKVVDSMVRKKLIIRDGSVDTRFVHINFGEHWLLHSCKNKNIFETVSADHTISRRPKDVFKLQESSEPLYITIRPWVHFNGTINEAALDSILTRVLSRIIKVPGLSLIGVQKKFLPALQPHCTRELLEFLEQLNCIRSYVFSRKNKPSLFSTSMEYTIEEEVLGFEDEDTIIYEPLPHAFLAFSVFLSSTNSTDLLETKYTSGAGYEKDGFSLPMDKKLIKCS